MKGWSIYKDSANSLKPEAYEMNKLVQVAEEDGVTLDVFSPERFDLLVTSDDDGSILIDGKPQPLPDFILPRMGAGTTYFALAVMRHLERLGVYSVNSSESIETVKDKLYTQQILAQNSIPVPKTMLVKFPINVDLVEKTFGFPVVVKTLSGSQGSGVFLSESKTSFKDLMQLMEATSPKANIILQKYLSTSKGKDLRVFTLGGKAIACIERSAPKGEFKANYSAGGSVKPYTITPEIEWLATQTSRILGLNMAGIDLLFDKDHYKICEANSSPGFEGIESCCDVDISKEIFHFLRVRLGKFRKKKENNTQ